MFLSSWQKPLASFSQKLTRSLATSDTTGNVRLILYFFLETDTIKDLHNPYMWEFSHCISHGICYSLYINLLGYNLCYCVQPLFLLIHAYKHTHTHTHTTNTLKHIHKKAHSNKYPSSGHFQIARSDKKVRHDNRFQNNIFNPEIKKSCSLPFSFLFRRFKIQRSKRSNDMWG